MDDTLDHDVFFRRRWYAAANPDVAAAVTTGQFPDLQFHYFFSGAKEGRSPSPLFDEAFYLAHNADVAAAVGSGAGQVPSGLYHFAARGAVEGRNPSAAFDSLYYVQHNASVAGALASGLFDSPVEHYVRVGQGQGLPAHA